MAATVNISFQEDLLREIDLVAKSEARSRSELIREAARLYLQRKQRWDQLFQAGQEAGARVSMTNEELVGEIRALRVR